MRFLFYKFLQYIFFYKRLLLITETFTLNYIFKAQKNSHHRNWSNYLNRNETKNLKIKDKGNDIFYEVSVRLKFFKASFM